MQGLGPGKPLIFRAVFSPSRLADLAGDDPKSGTQRMT